MNRQVGPHSIRVGRLVVFALTVVACNDSDAGASESEVTSAGATWFRDVTEASGLDFVHDAGTSGDHHTPEVLGAGVALFDADGDDDLDIYLTNGHRLFPPAAPSERAPNRLFLQEGEADGVPLFVDGTTRSGLGDTGYGMGVAVGDVDNDGDLDLYLANLGQDRLFSNADGVFGDITASAGTDVGGWSCSATFLDHDRDGWLDIFVVRYVAYDESEDCFDSAGRPEFCGPKSFAPVTDVLLRNEGDVTFRDVSEEAGLTGFAAAGLGVAWDDLDGDGWIDVAVANDAYPNQLWINQRDGTFRDDAVVLGVAFNDQGSAEAGMGIVAADLDGDGLSDLFLTHLALETNTVYRNLGERGFADVTAGTGLARSSMPFTGFGTVAVDLELDGDLDLLVANGAVKRNEAPYGRQVPPPWDDYAEPNLIYLNDGAGNFERLGADADPFCAAIEVTRGLAAGDVDKDGDVDLVVANVDGPARLYLNQTTRSGSWLSVRATDPLLGRDALGAHVTAIVGPRRIARTIGSAHSYLSSSPPKAHFGLGDVDAVDSLIVRWPEGERERFGGSASGREVVLVRGEGEAMP